MQEQQRLPQNAGRGSLFNHLVGASEDRWWNTRPSLLAAFRLMTIE
jgi:hypothetical protein